MNYLDFLIQDCLREYANDYIPSAIDASTAQSTQSAKFIDVPLLEQNFFSFKNTNLVSQASPAISSLVPSNQSDNAVEIPSVFPAKENLSGIEPIESLHTVSPIEAPAATLSARLTRLICPQCMKSYLGVKQLLRHQLKHNEPYRYSCTVAGCERKTYRLDGMRSHVKSHERRILKDAKRLQDSKT
jgi:uncharacterized Zn-finger protein